MGSRGERHAYVLVSREHLAVNTMDIPQPRKGPSGQLRGAVATSTCPDVDSLCVKGPMIALTSRARLALDSLVGIDKRAC